MQAFDQDAFANEVYAANHLLQPDATNLDSLKSTSIAQADLWWLSPPCTPYSTRGAQKGLSDHRARSLVNLLQLAAHCRPKAIVIENVLGFLNSDAHRLAERTLKENDYLIHTLMLCSSDFNIPMRRPRLFLYAVHLSATQNKSADRVSAQKEIAKQYAAKIKPQLTLNQKSLPVSQFVQNEVDPDLVLSSEELERYKWCMDIVDINEVGRNLICFTSGYGKFYRASGSFLQTDLDTVRRFSPREILTLLAFGQEFVIPGSMNLHKQWKLVGNSLDLRCVNHVLALDQVARI